jgi:rRNA pseudouridine-1189 N-methylase Emg1 (Nep1/Mra1 family)
LVSVIFILLRQSKNNKVYEKKRNNKKVGEFDIVTNELLKEYDSIYCASQLLNIPFTSFGNYIRTQTVVKGKYYKLL